MEGRRPGQRWQTKWNRPPEGGRFHLPSGDGPSAYLKPLTLIVFDVAATQLGLPCVVAVKCRTWFAPRWSRSPARYAPPALVVADFTTGPVAVPRWICTSVPPSCPKQAPEESPTSSPENVTLPSCGPVRCFEYRSESVSAPCGGAVQLMMTVLPEKLQVPFPSVSTHDVTEVC